MAKDGPGFVCLVDSRACCSEGQGVRSHVPDIKLGAL